MAFNDLERKKIENELKLFIAKIRPAPHIRPDLDFGFNLSGQSVELFEIRPQWDNKSIIRKSPFAKATFVKTQNVWKVYWKRQNQKWYGYEPTPAVVDLGSFLSAVERDEYACFFG